MESDLRVCSALESYSPELPMGNELQLYCSYCFGSLLPDSLGCCADESGRYYSIHGTAGAFGNHYAGLLCDPLRAGGDVHHTLWIARAALESLLVDDAASAEPESAYCVELYSALEKHG